MTAKADCRWVYYTFDSFAQVCATWKGDAEVQWNDGTETMAVSVKASLTAVRGNVRKHHKDTSPDEQNRYYQTLRLKKCPELATVSTESPEAADPSGSDSDSEAGEAGEDRVTLKQFNDADTSCMGRNGTSSRFIDKDTDAINTPLPLPFLIQLATRHPMYGMIRMIAVLLWVDDWKQYKNKMRRDQSTFELWQFGIKENGEDSTRPARACAFHCILEVHPRLSPLQLLVGKYFSSPNASVGAAGLAGNGWTMWNLYSIHKISLLDIVLKHRFFNHRQLTIPLQYPNVEMPDIAPRDMIALRCYDECDEYRCLMVDEGAKCFHNHKHEYDQLDGEVNPDAVQWSESQADHARGQRLKQSLNTVWGRRIQFSRRFTDARRQYAYIGAPESAWRFDQLWDLLNSIHQLLWPSHPFKYAYRHTYEPEFLLPSRPDVDFRMECEEQFLLIWREYFYCYLSKYVNPCITRSQFSVEDALPSDTVFLVQWKLINRDLHSTLTNRKQEIDDMGWTLWLPMTGLELMTLEILKEHDFPLLKQKHRFESKERSQKGLLAEIPKYQLKYDEWMKTSDMWHCDAMEPMTQLLYLYRITAPAEQYICPETIPAIKTLHKTRAIAKEAHNNRIDAEERQMEEEYTRDRLARFFRAHTQEQEVCTETGKEETTEQGMPLAKKQRIDA